MAIINDETKRLDLPKPNAQNFLQDDVERLREALEDIGQLAATIAADGKLDPAQIPDSVAQWDANQIIDASHMPGTVVQTDSNGKIPLANIPQAAQVSRFSVSTEAAMLALPAIPGDICRRTDIPAYFLLMDTPATNRDAWRRLHADSFYDQFAPRDNPLAGVKGPLALKAEGTGNYDAATVGQVNRVAAIAGGGASMSAVMNNFIGAVEWYNGPRTGQYTVGIAGYRPADGQIVQRSEVPDIVTAMKAGLLNVVPAMTATSGPFAGQPRTSDQRWVTSDDPDRPTAHRSSFSWGDGDENSGTTIRLPDLNGVQLNSIKHLFLSGQGTGNAEPSPGQVWMQSAPEIYGYFSGLTGSQFQIGGGSAVHGTGPDVTRFNGKSGSSDNVTGYAPNNYGWEFKASYSNATYARLPPYQNDPADIIEPKKRIGDLYPNHAVGIWVIRVTGSFSAANTDFNVIANDPVAPQTGTLIKGGDVISRYRIAGTEHISARLQAQGNYLQDGWAALSVVDETGVTPTKSIKIHGSGITEIPSLLQFGKMARLNANPISAASGQVQVDLYSPGYPATRLAVGGGYVTRKGTGGPWGGPSNQGTGNLFNFDWGSDTVDSRVTQPIELWIDVSNRGLIQMVAQCDRHLKKDIQYKQDADRALSEVMRWKPATFRFKGFDQFPESGIKTGFIAQDLMPVSPDCVMGQGLQEGYDPHNPVGAYHLDELAMMTKLVQAVQVLTRRIEALETRK